MKQYPLHRVVVAAYTEGEYASSLAISMVANALLVGLLRSLCSVLVAFADKVAVLSRGVQTPLLTDLFLSPSYQQKLVEA